MEKKGDEEKRYAIYAIENGLYTEDETVQALKMFGRENFEEATEVVVKLLKTGSEQLRATALKTLTWYWKKQEYWETACSFLLHEQDIDCRLVGAYGIGTLKAGTNDYESLHILAQRVADDFEEEEIRQTAYEEMQEIITGIFPIYDEFLKEFDEKDVDWEMVRSFL